MGKHTSLRVTQSFKLSLNPLIVPNRLRRGSERGVNCEQTPFTGNNNRMEFKAEGVRFNDPVTSFQGKI